MSISIFRAPLAGARGVLPHVFAVASSRVLAGARQ
jgi:hypothetical protein